MVRRRRCRICLRGHSSFLVPVHHRAQGRGANDVLSRLSRGLLACAAAGSRAQALLFANILIFPSSPASSRCPDANTVADTELDGFVAAMDEISGGSFLFRGEGEVDLMAMAWKWGYR